MSIDQKIFESFVQRINELFDRVLPYTWVSTNSRYSWKGYFNTNNATYVFEAEVEFDAEDRDRYWDIVFYITHDDPLTSVANMKDFEMIPSGGNEYQVMSTVLTMLDEFITKVQPLKFKFNSETTDVGRTKLYSRMVKRYANRYGYEYTTDVTDNNKEFSFTKKTL